MASLFKFKKKNTAVEESKDLLSTLNGYYTEAKDTTKNRRDKWRLHYNYWINKQLSESRPSYRSDIRVNYCWTITQVKTPVMTQNRPTVSFISYDSSEEEENKASKLSKLVGNALWNKLNIQSTLIDVILNSQIYDAGFWKVGFDPNKENGIGEIFASSIEPFKILPDPSSKKLEDCRYIIHVEPYPVETLRKKYPEYSKYIASDPEISTILNENRRYESRAPTSNSTYTDTTKFSSERAFVKEFWIHPDECDQSILVTIDEQITEVPGVDENGLPTMIEEVTKIQEPKYKNGRVVTMVGTNIVSDKPNPYNCIYPFVIQLSNKVPDDLWGMGDLEQIIPLQDALNHIYQQEDDIITKTANPGWVVSPEVGDEIIKKLQNSIDKPGSMKIVDPNMLRADVPPQMPYGIIQQKQDIKFQIETVSGITEILQGSGRAQHRTARGLEILNESATSRIGLSIRLMEDSIKQVAQKMAMIAQQFYTEDRVFAIVGSSKSSTDILKISPEDIDGEFEVTVDSGVALPKDKKSRADLAFNLLGNHIFEMAMSDDQKQKQMAKVVLDSVEWPGRESLLSYKPPAPLAPPASASAPGTASPAGNPLAAILAAAGGPTNGVQ